MAASKSRQLHENPSHSTPETRVKHSPKKEKVKGKGKENVQCPVTRKRQVQNPSSPKSGSSSAWDWRTLTDPSASRTQPLYTNDGSYFFSLVGSSVRIYSVATGQVVSTFSAPRSPNAANELNTLTSAVLNPCNAFQLITGSLDGRILVWDFLDATLLQSIDVGQPIHHICAHEKFKDSVFVAASGLSKKKNNDDAVILQVSLRVDAGRSLETQNSPVITVIGKTKFPTGLAFSPTGTWLVAAAGHKVYVATSSSLVSGFVKYVSPDRLTCLAFHPFDDYFATGDKKGVIRLWYCLNESLAINVKGIEKRTQTTSFHWHAHAVSSIAFTSNGAYLLSGGEEAVLVIWQLHTGKKEFVPRLGAPISTVSVSRASGDEEYLIGLADATFSFVSPGSLRVSRSYSGIKLDAATFYARSASNSSGAPIAVHTTTSSIILPSSHPSSLQIYSPSSAKLLYELEVAPSNRVSRRDDKFIEPPRVERVIISLSGQWMATIDTREEDETFHAEIYLKLWRWDYKTGFWILNTRIDRPHGLKRITDLAFSPSPSSASLGRLVTTGEDGIVKIWGIRTIKNKGGQTEESWGTYATFTFRSEVPNSVSWSPDASLLAISLGPHVAIYDPSFNVIRQTISLPESQATTTVRFIGKTGRYLVVASKRDLVLWDLVTQSARWSYRTSTPIQQIFPHPREDSFVVFQNSPTDSSPKTTVLILNAMSASPASEQVVPHSFRSIVLYAPYHSQPGFSFVGITVDWGIVSFGEQVLHPELEGSSSNKIFASAAPQRRTLFQDIFGLSALENLQSEQTVSQTVSTTIPRHQNAAIDVFDGPSHLLPPISSLFDAIMEHHSHTQAPIYQDDKQTTEVDEDIDMEAEVPEVVVESQSTRQVSQDVVDGLVNLFKSHTIGIKYTTPVSNTNGKSSAQQEIRVNGGTHHAAAASPSPSTRKLNGMLTPKPSDIKQASASTASPLMAEDGLNQRKRRKKSLG
ncbi:hypothetical protein AX17_000882 [Amanita inopinata Kibby_2008]|nr:hypothetical protein AX17_000882 [Amanita inopinata Kibby_2008]